MTEIKPEEQLKPLADMGVATEIGIHHSHKTGGENEDSAETIPGIGAVLSDGMGGHKNGKAASSEIVSGLRDFLQSGRLAEIDNEADAVAAVTAAIESVHQSVLAKGDARGGTACLVAYWKGKTIVAWVGDSRVYRQRDGKLEQLTLDHSRFMDTIVKNDKGNTKRAVEIQHMIARGYPEKDILAKLSKKDAYEKLYYYRRNNIARCIGGHKKSLVEHVIESPANPQVMVIDRKAGDRYILTSDGPPENITIDTMQELMNKHRVSQEAADAIMERVKIQRSTTLGHDDDLTVVVVGDQGPDTSKSRPKIPSVKSIVKKVVTRFISNPKERDDEVVMPVKPPEPVAREPIQVIEKPQVVTVLGQTYRKGDFLTIRYPTPYDAPRKMYIGAIEDDAVSLSYQTGTQLKFESLPKSRLYLVKGTDVVIPVIDDAIGAFHAESNGFVHFHSTPMQEGDVYVGKSDGTNPPESYIIMGISSEVVIFRPANKKFDPREEMRDVMRVPISRLHTYLDRPAGTVPDEYISSHEAELFPYIEERLTRSVEAGEPREELQTVRLAHVHDTRRMAALMLKREQYRHAAETLTGEDQQGRRELNMHKYLIMSALLRYTFVNRRIMEDYARQSFSDIFQSEDESVRALEADTFNQAWEVVAAYGRGDDADIADSAGLPLNRANPEVGEKYRQAVMLTALYTPEELAAGR